MATNKESESEENNDASTSGDNEQEGLTADQAGEYTYNEADAWKKSKNTLFMFLGAIAIAVTAYYIVDTNSKYYKL